MQIVWSEPEAGSDEFGVRSWGASLLLPEAPGWNTGATACQREDNRTCISSQCRMGRDRFAQHVVRPQVDLPRRKVGVRTKSTYWYAVGLSTPLATKKVFLLIPKQRMGTQGQKLRFPPGGRLRCEAALRGWPPSSACGRVSRTRSAGQTPTARFTIGRARSC